tara:strand:+ start:1298 stop:1756 length:459 start_codon:yes stop_codon:yes gene_type:complete
MKIGQGKILNNKGDIGYEAVIPFSKGDKILIIKKKDLTALSNQKLELLLANNQEMEDFHWNPEWTTLVDDCANCPHIADELNFKAKDGTIHKLFLERRFYSHNFKDYILMRYVSADQAFTEEWPELEKISLHPERTNKQQSKDCPGQGYLPF